MKFLGVILATFLSTSAFAGFQGINGTTNLGIFNKVTCSTGLTCTKVKDAFSIVSSPQISSGAITVKAGSSSAATIDVQANNNAVSGDDWQISSKTSEGGLALLNNTSGSLVQKWIIAVDGSVTVSSAQTVTGHLITTGGIGDGTSLKTRWATWNPGAVANATSTTASASTSVYMSQIYVPHNESVTGIGILNAATCGSTKWIVALFDKSGTAVANSNTAGVTCSGASAFQQIAFTAPYTLTGPGTFWIGLYANNTTDTFYTMPSLGQMNGLAGVVNGVAFGTVGNVTLPTSFTAAQGPVSYIY